MIKILRLKSQCQRLALRKLPRTASRDLYHTSYLPDPKKWSDFYVHLPPQKKHFLVFKKILGHFLKEPPKFVLKSNRMPNEQD